MKTYLLLRNNKESGPYTTDELIRSGLKPYDLVWIEGRSTAWRYPSEVDELKAHAPVVEEQPFDRFYKKTSPAKTAVEEEKAAPKKEKPRFRIAAAWKKIETTPAAAAIVATSAAEIKETPVTCIAAAAPSWKEVYSEWKTNPSPQPEAVKPARQHKIKDPVELETKYSQSLDEIKERYVESFLKPRNKKGFSLDVNAKQIGESMLVVLVIAFGLWMVFRPGAEKANENAALVEKSVPVKEQANPTPAESEQANNEEENVSLQQNSNVPSESNPVAEPLTENNANIISFDKPKQTSKQQPRSVTPKSNLPVRYASNGSGHVPANVSTQPVAGVRNATRRNGNVSTIESPLAKNAVLTENTEAQKRAVAQATAPVFKNTSFKSVDQLVKVDQINRPSGVVQDVKLNLQNMTNSILDLVVVDLQYFDKKGFYKKGETLYIKNVPANRDVVIKTPDDLSASNVTYKVSLISSEQKGLYVVAD